tara:strand:- start:141 stop:287 length:147 start_codon:yes stop_codon:yes gene_type:complete
MIQGLNKELLEANLERDILKKAVKSCINVCEWAEALIIIGLIKLNIIK